MTSVYQLRADELRLLEDACREIDLIERLRVAINSPRFGLTTRGSMGQTVANPLLGEIRQHRATLAAMLKQLKLPDMPAAGGAGAKRESDTSTNARRAAAARWGRNG